MSKKAWFLAKTDPETYSVDKFRQDGQTVWDGVRNPQALKAIRAMKKGDGVLIYHSMGKAAIVGVAEVTGDGRPDPKDSRLAVANFRFRGMVDPPVTLTEIKATNRFGDWQLVKQSRLSTMAVPESFMEWLSKLRPEIKF